MKSLTSAALLISILASSALAAPPAGRGEGDPGPCREIRKACDAAGFKRGAHAAGKGLWADCMSKISKGESVPGVNVTADQVKACKQLVAERVAKRKAARSR